MKQIEGGVTSPKGFMAAAAEANIKYKNRTDMAMVYSETPCISAGVYTSNVVKAAPVLWDKAITKSDKPVHAIVANSGIANACTGQQGLDYCKETADAVAKALSVPADSVLVASTGVIGMQLPMDRIIGGVDLLKKALAGGKEAGDQAARAIMTTDTVPKQVAVEITLGGKTVTIGGMSKGSGMIHPNMCTMLGFVTTDACISKELLQEIVSTDVQDTFNMISVDGDTSTNDTLVVLANGLAGNPEVKEKGADYETFFEAFHFVCESLAKKMAADGEGATALFETKVLHAANKMQAKILAKSVICSSLTKAAIYGHDANWGRILCALGYSGVSFDPDKVDLWFESKAGKILIFTKGSAAPYSEEEATKILSEPEVTVIADMKAGDAQATAWGCDLTYDYVKINADYRS
ncbi:MAG: bifunctional glutamate N-acetyltransferase/amino-acid acetyltransferase ArgJ [Lachnospiraceae bacterium]|nr:bifunctional glutamate N-acetyltransferase/amino-acid acetyltransferase ArgJ [Lachnospiraceae bacterium]